MTQVVTVSICLSHLQQAADPSMRVLATLLYAGPALPVERFILRPKIKSIDCN